jgi:CHAT domain-containing protein/Tfp pilus assembly protein PilF
MKMDVFARRRQVVMSERRGGHRRPASSARQIQGFFFVFLWLCLQGVYCPPTRASLYRSPLGEFSTAVSEPAPLAVTAGEDLFTASGDSSLLEDQEPQTAPVTRLGLNTPLEREMSGTQKHVYQVPLAERQYAKFMVEQRGIDVVVRLLGPDEKVILELDGESRLEGQEILEVVAGSAGDYKVEIGAKYKLLPAGRYEIRLADLRAATEKDSSLEEARRLLWQARQAFNAGNAGEAAKLGEKSLRLREETLGPDHVVVSDVLFNLGLYYRNVGDVPKAEELYLRSLAIKEKAFGPDHVDVSLVLHNLAYLYHDSLRDYRTAEPLYRRALAIKEKVLGAEHPLVAATLNNLGMGEWKKGDYVKAEAYYQRSRAIVERASGPESNEVGNAMLNLGIVYKESGDYAKGEENYRGALQIWEKLLGGEHPRVALALESLGILYRDRGDYLEAEPLLQRALQIGEKTEGVNHPNVANTLVLLARLYEAKGDLDRAIELQTRANAIEEKNIALNLSIGSERQKLSYFSHWIKQEQRRVSLHVRAAPENRAALELAATTILQRKGRVLDAMANTFSSVHERLNVQDKILLDQLQGVTEQLGRLILAGPRGVAPAEHEQKVRSLEERREQIESEIGRRSAGLYQPSQSVTLAGVRAAIPRDAALIEFVVYRASDPRMPIERERESYGDARYVAYLIRNQGEVRWADLGAASEIDAAIDKWRAALRDPERKDVRRLSQAVDGKVLRPIRSLIGDATHLLISPDGALNLVPFAALADERGRYLVERYSLTYLTSGRDLLRMQTKREGKGNAVVVADPAFGDPAVIGSRVAAENGGAANGRAQLDYSQIFFGPLPGVGDEVRALNELMPQATFYTRGQATKAALKRVSSPSVLHIATHAFFLDNGSEAGERGVTQEKSETRLGKLLGNVQNPLLRSGLALAGANRNLSQDNDGVITAFEMTQLDLLGTKLVVLSACDTGVGEIKNGEGVYGLRRAVVLAGAESQLVSLWPVSDRSTRDLMIGYYKGLMQNEGRSEALRRMQLRMLRGAEKNAHPYYWASFIQLGEWANLKGQR